MSKFTFFQAEICNISALIYKKRPPLNISKVAVLPSFECPVAQHFCMFSYFFCLHPYPRVTFRGFRRALRHGLASHGRVQSLAFTPYAGIEPRPCDALYSVHYLLALLCPNVWHCQSKKYLRIHYFNCWCTKCSNYVRIGMVFRLIKAGFYMR